LLDRSAHKGEGVVSDRYIVASSTAEANRVEAQEDSEFQQWVNRIYTKYTRQQLNHFEHNVQVTGRHPIPRETPKLRLLHLHLNLCLCLFPCLYLCIVRPAC
jgi:hypothetical protein